MKIKHLLTVLLLIAILQATTIPAAAHRPGWGNPNGLTEINDIQISYAFYRDLHSITQVDTYAFSGKAGEHLHAGISIPAIQGLESYNVNLALFGPGLPAAGHNALPPGHPEELGALVFPPQPGKTFFEPFTQTNYWERQSIELTLPETGEYYLLVWQPDEQTGKYVMDVGHDEVFGPLDILRFPIWWLQVHAFFGQGPLLAAILGSAALVSIGYLFFRQQKRAVLVSNRKNRK